MIGSTTAAPTDFTQIPSKPRSILSKITSPFTPRQRNLAEYYIKTKEPHRQYSPGDRVNGAVVVTVTKPIRITHLVVCLHAYVKVFNNAKLPGESISPSGSLLGGGTGKRGCEYFGNGFASLFENEMTLCGEGRLETGSFEFQFDLELPAKGLPSSISFERGTISYMVTSTLTRPSTIAPIATCDRSLQFVETVDIGAFPQPKPQLVSVQTLSRRPMTKMSARKSGKMPRTGRSPAPSNVGSQSSANGASPPDPPRSNEPPLSPVSSTRSAGSATSSSVSMYQLGSARPLPKTSVDSDHRTSNDEAPDNLVTATIELLRRGCLPGDKLPLQISINHKKPVKSLQGIIITLYRKCHVDTHPAIPLGPSQSKKKQEYEDYYPKSRTGLGGLSLSTAGSSSGFRKDLSQRFVPLIVDPQSLTAIVKTSIQVPDDLFPTITSVPGAMIAFRYFVEVVIDLRGKLAGQDRFLPRLNMTSGIPTYGYSDCKANGMDGSDSYMASATSGLDLLVTEQIRREKGVVACLFEVIVGTRDSSRRRGRPAIDFRSSGISQIEAQKVSDEDGTQEAFRVSPDQEQAYSTSQAYDERRDFQISDDRYCATNGLDHWQSNTIPPPIFEEAQDEKSRIRRAEQQLLPSAPAEPSIPLPSHLQEYQPSAPAVDDGDFALVHRRANSHMSTHDRAMTGPSAPAETGRGFENCLSRPQVNGVTSTPAGSRDDKQELERRRLQLAASSPDDILNGEGGEPDSHDHQHLEPTAPSLTEEYPLRYYDRHDVYSTSQIRTARAGSEALPVYEK